ncbi:MAG: hypothetical protein CL920_13255 [Deltaproteobacteria bacterium]|nr:hypothetical protein [Deltaproteobacteria bacterium]MBU49657.1 hypothetical protein [Deltaproteobacteria bacterium]
MTLHHSNVEICISSRKLHCFVQTKGGVFSDTLFHCSFRTQINLLHEYDKACHISKKSLAKNKILCELSTYSIRFFSQTSTNIPRTAHQDDPT